MLRPIACALLLLAAAPAAAAADPAAAVAGWLEEARDHVPQIDAATLHEWVSSERDFVLLDVRLPAERSAQGSIDPFREVDIPRGYLELKAPDKLADTEAAVVVYCGTGKRSLLAARTLQRMGYSDVTNLSGGVHAWQEAGYELAP
ncbi:MAG TPA: rhodanese-like domain-containing protein [Gammaproteobacteria bacterium]|nr:rhodanese-like domain-containing protein [Gammaproteobacteria bacterium]